jgi:ferric-dicitrate binding protein FerR (iron transport regulator)
MSIQRITLSVQEHVASRIKKAAGKTPVSAWVASLVEEHLDEAELEQQFLAFCAAHPATGAELTRAEAILAELRGGTVTKSSGRLASRHNGVR